LSGFFSSPKTSKGVQKKPEFQNLASKKPNWQPYPKETENFFALILHTGQFWV